MSDVVLEGFGGGGGASLNFKVVGNPQPSNPKENTIWVNTDTEITSWIFSATEPESPSAGMVWISTGTSSAVEFNALKKNSIQVCPLSAKQYVDGAWVDVTAMSYKGGVWSEWWAGELYSYGDKFEHITGGWIPYKMSFVTDVTAVDPTIVDNGDSVSISISQSGAKGGSYITNNKISFDGKTSLVFTGTASGDNTARCCVAIWSEVQRDFDQNRVATYNFSSGFSGNATIDISGLSGEYYVGIHVYGSNKAVVMQEMKLV